MSSIVQVVLTNIATGEEYDGFAFRDDKKYEAVWNEGGLRLIFNFDENGSQIGINKYSLRRADTP